MSDYYEAYEDPSKIWDADTISSGIVTGSPRTIDFGSVQMSTIVFRDNQLDAVIDEPCGQSWLLDLRWVGLACLILVALIVVTTRLMR